MKHSRSLTIRELLTKFQYIHVQMDMDINKIIFIKNYAILFKDDCNDKCKYIWKKRKIQRGTETDKVLKNGRRVENCNGVISG